MAGRRCRPPGRCSITWPPALPSIPRCARCREDERVLEALAAQTAVALDNARAWDEVRRLEQRLAAENLYLREEVQLAHDVTGIVGDSEGMRSVLARAEQVAATDATIMVQGETGTGKELVVHAIHAASLRKDRALVKIACAALPEQLLESELFGHERGAFTGAVGRKAGRFEVADGGTIFFDDVDTLSLGVQAKLLRALQEGEVQRLGSNEVRRVDVRVIAATNRDLLADVRAGRFREDLYYRLNVVPLHIPPLRERREDIALLVEHFIQQDGQRLGRSTVRAVSSETLEALRSYAWPGNVRELRNVIQRALVLSRGEVLRLPAPLEAIAPSTLATAAAAAASLAEQVRDLKVRLIRSALAESGGNQRLAAEKLGMHRQSLTRMIRDLGLQERGARGSS
jgi:formate hydrogenlyase transcriptional activator